MALPQANPEKAGFDAARLKAIDAMMKSRYLDTGRLPFSALLVSREEKLRITPFRAKRGRGKPYKKMRFIALPA